MNAPSLGLLNPKNDIRLETDASDYGLGARLYERSIKRDEMVDGVRVIEYGPEVDIMYISHSFRANEIAWPIADKECYAIVYAVEKLDFIIDQVPITVLTDHKNLIRIQESKNKRVQLWKQKLLRQIITYEFIAGKDNIYADAFSRIVEISDSDKDHIEEIEHFNMINDIINEDKYGLFALSKKERLNSYSKEQEGESEMFVCLFVCVCVCFLWVWMFLRKCKVCVSEEVQKTQELPIDCQHSSSGVVALVG